MGGDERLLRRFVVLIGLGPGVRRDLANAGPVFRGQRLYTIVLDESVLQYLAYDGEAWLQRVRIFRREANCLDGKSGSLKPGGDRIGDLVGKAGALASRRLVAQ